MKQELHNQCTSNSELMSLISWFILVSQPAFYVSRIIDSNESVCSVIHMTKYKDTHFVSMFYKAINQI